MRNALLITQIILSASLIVTILLQKRGAGLGGAFGGGGNVYYQKRGAEKILYNSTIVLSILFVGVAFAILLLSSGN
ncbi:MAG: preprotein translocase subunit SecG [Candidatus Spechtbacterales bacterium]|nr:preprotein translocase subunit SecG [Candidatus Spechtbacterales bacterium]